MRSIILVSTGVMDIGLKSDYLQYISTLSFDGTVAQWPVQAWAYGSSRST